MVDRMCKCCKKPFQAKQADINRGWAKYCSKRCKAIKQEQRTHANRDYWVMREDIEKNGVQILAPGHGQYVGCDS